MKRSIYLLLSVVWLVGCQEEKQDPLRLKHDVMPLEQTILLSLDPDKDTYSGTTDIELEFHTETDQFRFHAEGMELSELQLDGKDLAWSEHEKGTIHAVLPEVAKPGRYRLSVHFSNDYSRSGAGIYKTVSEGKNYLFTQMEPEYARKSFPCWDAPEFKIPWQLTIIAPSDVTVLSNTPVEERIERPESVSEILFAQTEPMPSYLFALAIGSFDQLPVEGMSTPGSIYAPTGKIELAKEAARMSPPLLSALEAYFEREQPYAKMDQIAVPEFNSGAMENVGLITYRDTILLADPKTATTKQMQWMASVIAHEMAHMWFGNLVTPTWWDDLWLNESFASWIALKMVNQVFPEYGMANNDLGSRNRAMYADALPTAKAIRRFVAADEDMHNLFNALAYNKGMAVLNMVENWQGEEAFRQGMVHYIQQNAWGHADAFDLAEALDTIDESNIQRIMTGFITQPGIPVLTVEPLSPTQIRITQSRYQLEGASPATDLKWTIPIVLRTDQGTQKVLLTKKAQKITLKQPANWIYPNAEEKGYYRWKLPAAQMLQLAEQVRTLDLRLRMGYLDNLSALYAAGEVTPSAYLKTFASFSSDPSVEVMERVASRLADFIHHSVPPRLQEAYINWMADVLKPMLEHIGTSQQPGENILTESVRSSLIYSLGWHAKDPEIIQLAQEKRNAYLTDPYAIEPALIQPFLRIAARNGNADTFAQYIERFETTSDPSIKQHWLAGIAAFRTPELMQRALDYALTDAVLPHVFNTLPYGIADTDDNRRIVLRWMKKHYPAIAQKAPVFRQTKFVWLANGQSPELLDEIAFLLAPPNNTPAIEAEAKKVLETVRHTSALRKKGIRHLNQFLAQ